MGGACAPPACPMYFHFVTVCAYRTVETSLLSARKSQSKSSAVGGHFLSFKSRQSVVFVGRFHLISMRVMPSATAKSGAHRTDERRWNDANERIYPRRRHRGVGPTTIARDGEKPDASAPGETRRPSLGERGEDQGDRVRRWRWERGESHD